MAFVISSSWLGNRTWMSLCTKPENRNYLNFCKTAHDLLLSSFCFLWNMAVLKLCTQNHHMTYGICFDNARYYTQSEVEKARNGFKCKILIFGSLALEMLKNNQCLTSLGNAKKTTNLSQVLEMLDLGAVTRMSPLDRPPSPYSQYGLAI